ncbi:MAG: C40 family peptidase [Clostridia bacterium]|nr:C40 family peptidase [Clostridia bacterium]
MIRKVLTRAAILFTLVLSFAFLASAADATISANGGLRMRSAMSTNSGVILTIPSGATVNVTERGDSWCKVTYSGKTGYVSTRYLVFGAATTSRSGEVRDSLAQKRQVIVNAAVAQLGKPYRSGYNGPYSFDCSGLTQYVYKICGYSIERGPSSQLRSLGVSVSKENLLPGDLVFFRDSRYGSGVATHVGIYVGNGQMIHAPNRNQTVKYTTINSGYYAKYYIGARRVVN